VVETTIENERHNRLVSQRTSIPGVPGGLACAKPGSLWAGPCPTPSPEVPSRHATALLGR
jgi:hypothetical protein